MTQNIDDTTVWAKLSAPLPSSAISWRQDGKPTARDGRFFARFVAYVEANTVRQRLDATVPGNWDLTLDLLPPSANYEGAEGLEISLKARLQILGVIRENVGSGKDYKSAATDAFKRAAVQFNIGSELYDFEQNWVEVDGDSKYSKPVEDPQKAYERRHSGAKVGASPVSSKADSGENPKAGGAPAPSPKAKRPADKPMPFGKTKGKKLGDLSDSDLESTLTWCKQTDEKKFKDLIADIEAVLEHRLAVINADPESYPDALREREEDFQDLPF